MVNPRAIGQKFTKSEAKELLDSSKKLIDEKIFNIEPNSIFKNTSLKGIVYGIISNGKISLNE